MEPSAVISVRDLRKTYRHFTLGPVDLDVPRGRVLGLVGPNGAGKSTILRALIGLVRLDAGRVTILGEPMPAREVAIKARTAFVSEDMALYGAATLRWHIDLVRRLSPRWDDALAERLLERLDLNPCQTARGLSRGQQVKALLLLALARRTDVLLLDEPTADLDPIVRREVVSLLADSRGDRQAMVFSSHHSEDVAGLADDVAFVMSGRIVAHGPVAGFVSAGRTLETAFLEHVDGLRIRGAA